MRLEHDITLNPWLKVHIVKEISRKRDTKAFVRIEGSILPEDFVKVQRLKKLTSAIDQLSKVMKNKADNWLEIIDDLTTDIWGGAGPDCRLARVTPAC